MRSVKEAGLIKPPRKLVNDMNDFLCHHVTLLIAYGPEHFRERWSKEDIELLRKSGRFSSSEISDVEDFDGGFFVEEFFELSEYGIKGPVSFMTFGKPLFKTITLAVEHEERQWNTLGSWNAKHSEININSAFFQKVGSEDGLSPKLLCNYIKSTLIHELTHAMQYIMHHEPHTKLETRGGFPAKLKDLPYDIYSRKGDIAYLESKYGDPELAEMALHRLTPIEFYPLLLQEILGFRFNHQEKGINPTNSDIRKHLNSSMFFRFLKEIPKVYKKAVGIFVDEVNKSKEDGISYMKNAKMMTQFTNWIKGDSDLIEKYISVLGYHLESLVPPYLEAKWGYTGSDDLTLKLSMVHFPLINIVRKRNLNLNARAKEIQIRNTLEETFEVMDIHYDHDLKDLFGSVNYKEIPLIENLGTEIFSDEIEESFLSFLNVFKKTVCIHYVNEVIIPYLTQFTRGGGFHVAYDPHPLPYLNLPHGHFKNFRYKGSKTLKNGVLLSFNVASTYYGGRENQGTNFKFYFEGDSLKTEVNRDGKTLTFDGFLDDVSCLRIAYYGVRNHA